MVSMFFEGKRIRDQRMRLKMKTTKETKLKKATYLERPRKHPFIMEMLRSKEPVGIEDIWRIAAMSM
jgi:hypothetical protein